VLNSARAVLGLESPNCGQGVLRRAGHGSARVDVQDPATSLPALCVSLRVFAWAHQPASFPCCKAAAAQISSWNPRDLIRVHSWFNPTPAFPSRLRVFAWDQQTSNPLPAAASSRQPVTQRADLGLESPSYIHSCPFVSIRGSKSPLGFLRVFAASRETNRPQTPSAQRQASGSQSQRAELGLESPSYIDSCPFVVQNPPWVSFAASRETNSPQTPSAQRQASGSQSRRADLGLEGPSYIHSCPFVSIRGSNPTPHSYPSVAEKHPRLPPDPPDSGW